MYRQARHGSHLAMTLLMAARGGGEAVGPWADGDTANPAAIEASGRARALAYTLPALSPPPAGMAGPVLASDSCVGGHLQAVAHWGGHGPAGQAHGRGDAVQDNLPAPTGGRNVASAKEDPCRLLQRARAADTRPGFNLAGAPPPRRAVDHHRPPP